MLNVTLGEAIQIYEKIQSLRPTLLEIFKKEDLEQVKWPKDTILRHRETGEYESVEYDFLTTFHGLNSNRKKEHFRELTTDEKESKPRLFSISSANTNQLLQEDSYCFHTHQFIVLSPFQIMAHSGNKNPFTPEIIEELRTFNSPLIGPFITIGENSYYWKDVKEMISYGI